MDQYDLRASGNVDGLTLEGISGPEPAGRWTDGPSASIRFMLPGHVRDHVIVWLQLAPFLSGEALREQDVEVSASKITIGRWQLTDRLFRRRTLFVHRDNISAANEVELRFSIPNCTRPADLGLNQDKRRLGVMIKRLWWEETSHIPDEKAPVWQYGRLVGAEARKTFDDKIASLFWHRYVRGPAVLDIGFKGYLNGPVVPILEGAIGVDMDYPGYDGRTLPFADGSQDAVYSSHCLEHISDYIKAIQEWYRVTRVGGHIITVVPSAHLYERRWRPPSRHNDTHVRFYTPASLLGEFEQALTPNSYRVRHLIENDDGYDYADSPDHHPRGCYEIELVIEKIAGPSWTLAG